MYAGRREEASKVSEGLDLLHQLYQQADPERRHQSLHSPRYQVIEVAQLRFGGSAGLPGPGGGQSHDEENLGEDEAVCLDLFREFRHHGDRPHQL